jgi:hypothetical protein
MVPHRLATIDLGSDAMAYANAHAERLNSQAFNRYIACFGRVGAGYHAELESLIARTEELTQAIVENAPAAPLNGSRWLWAALEFGGRVFQIKSESDGDASANLGRIVEQLSEQTNEQGVAAAINAYAALHNEYELPTPNDVFAVGYELTGGYGRSHAQVSAGLQSAQPAALLFLNENRESAIAEFLAQDAPQRAPIARRFANFLGRSEFKPIAEIARFEAAIIDPRRCSTTTLIQTPDEHDGAWVRGQSGETIQCAYDVPRVIDAVLDGGEAPEEVGAPMAFAVVALPNGELGLIEISDIAAQRMMVAPGTAVSISGLDDDEIAALVTHGLIVPERYTA